MDPIEDPLHRLVVDISFGSYSWKGERSIERRARARWSALEGGVPLELVVTDERAAV